MSKYRDGHCFLTNHPSGKILGMLCRHCGTEVQVVLPLSVSEVAALSEDFTRRHAKCPKPAQAPPNAYAAAVAAEGPGER